MQVAITEAFESRAVGTDDVGVERLGGRDQPGIVFAEASRRVPLKQGTPTSMGEMKSLDGETLKRMERGRFVGSALQHLFDADHRHTSRRPRRLGKNRRAGPISPIAVSRLRVTRYDVSSRTGRLTTSGARGRDLYLTTSPPTSGGRRQSRWARAVDERPDDVGLRDFPFAGPTRQTGRARLVQLDCDRRHGNTLILPRRMCWRSSSGRGGRAAPCEI